MSESELDNKITKIYLREIGQTALITVKDEIRLAARIKRGDKAARDLMIRANLRLVVKIANDYARYGLPLLDLVSEGNIGLMKAVERFDPKKGGKLSTYAAWWIKQGIKRALANQSKTIRLPAHLVDKISKMRRADRKLSDKLGRDPTDFEIAKEMGVEPSTVTHWKTVSLRPSSLDAQVGDSDSASFGDLVGDDRARSPFDEINDGQLRTEMESLLVKLDHREQEILKHRFGLQGVEEETLEDVGKRFKVTRERVRQIQNEALKKLREMMEDNERVTPLDDLPDEEALRSAPMIVPSYRLPEPDAAKKPAKKTKGKKALART